MDSFIERFCAKYYFPYAEGRQLIEGMEYKTYRKGDCLVREGERDTSFYIIACGNYDETRKERKVYYNEGIFVGYRGYDRKQVEPLYPFGYGLSYTSFEYSDLQLTEIDKKNKSVALSFNITNTGGYEGAEVAQVYVRDIASKEARPLKELKGFQKVFLRPGETKHVSVTLDRDAFQYFSEKKSDWVFESGEFEIWVGASSKDIRLKTKVKM